MYTSGFNIGPSPQGPTKLHNMVYQGQDHVTIPRGRHEWKFGADIRRVQNNFNYDFYTNGSDDFGLYGYAPVSGTFTGTSLSDFVGGFPDNYYQAANAVYGIRTSSYYFYGQDTFKIVPRLTLVLGLRYEYNTPQSDIHNNILGYFGPSAQSTVFPDAPPGILYPGDPGTPNNALVYPDKNNWAPRFGFAWDMLGNSKLVMRGGFGIFYDLEDGAPNSAVWRPATLRRHFQPVLRREPVRDHRQHAGGSVYTIGNHESLSVPREWPCWRIFCAQGLLCVRDGSPFPHAVF